MKQAIPPKQLPTKGASLYTGIPEGTFRYLRSTGDGPPYRKINGRCYYEVIDLDVFVENHPKQKNTSDSPLPPAT